MSQFQMLIDGRAVAARSGAVIQSFDPSSGRAWATVPRGDAADAADAVEAAKNAFDRSGWREQTVSQRAAALQYLADRMRSKAERLAEIESIDTGKSRTDCLNTVAFLPRYFEYYAAAVHTISGAIPPLNNDQYFAYVQREPLGVVCAIVPWNSPLYLTTLKIAPALAAGNTVVIKPSEVASGSVLELLHDLDDEVFPPGVINIVTGYGSEVGAALVEHPDVAHVSFTGGTATARSIVAGTAKNLASTTLELGGKSAQIVFPDADLAAAAQGIIAGIFAATGQSCVAGSRLIVHRDVEAEVLFRVRDMAQEIRIGHPADPSTDIGPLCTREQRDRVADIVARSRVEGATVYYQADSAQLPAEGWFYPPTILTHVGAGNPAFREEIFGPVLAVSSFDNDDEAIALANDSDYGLAVGVWTSDIARAHRVSRSVDSGIAWVNTYRANAPAMPFEGRRDSGHGVEGGLESLLAYSRPKSTWINLQAANIGNPFHMR